MLVLQPDEADFRKRNSGLPDVATAEAADLRKEARSKKR